MKNIKLIQYDRYATEEGVFYTQEYILGEEYDYMHDRHAKLIYIFEETYIGGIRYHLIFDDGNELTVNDRDDINIIWE